MGINSSNKIVYHGMMGSPKGFLLISSNLSSFPLPRFRSISMQLFPLGFLSLVSTFFISFSVYSLLPIRHNIVDLLIISVGKSLHHYPHPGHSRRQSIKRLILIPGTLSELGQDAMPLASSTAAQRSAKSKCSSSRPRPTTI